MAANAVVRAERWKELAMDRVADRMIREAGCLEQFEHWTVLWMAMPQMAYRLTYCLGDGVAFPGQPPLAQVAFAASARAVDGWMSSSSTLELVRDAVRTLLNTCLELARISVTVGGVAWDPGRDGPLGEMVAHDPMAVVGCETRAAADAAGLVSVHRLLKHHVYCDICALTLRLSYERLMGLKEDL